MKLSQTDPFHVNSGSLLTTDLTTGGYVRWATDSVRI